MSSSDDDYQDINSPDGSSPNNFDLPASPLKRRRSASVDSVRSRKRQLIGKYHDSYRKLFNETVNTAADRFIADETFHPVATQFGVTTWSIEEKRCFFASLERLGKDDLPGIAKAIGSKSILEIRQYLLLVQDALIQRRSTKVAFQDIPAACEIGVECEQQLDVAGEALAWFQERFEAKQEQEKYGNFWLISPQIAEEIEGAILACQTSSAASSPRSAVNEAEIPATIDDESVPQILQLIPEAKLLVPAMLLQLSKHFFMNSSSNIPYPWSHWSALITELASEPSMYRTALRDFHTLTISLTKRLVQAAIIQATSRIRSQSWRVQRGVRNFVNPRDVVTAVDLLGLSRNSNERWRGVARRCGLVVRAGTRDTRQVNMPWDEVERSLAPADTSLELLSTEADTAGFTSVTEDEFFKSRATRAGTPLPTGRVPANLEEEIASSEVDEDTDSRSHTYQRSYEEASDSSLFIDSETATPSIDSSEDELNVIEEMDKAAAQREERMLQELFLESPINKGEYSHPKQESTERETRKLRHKLPQDSNNWRSWTSYRAEWEEFQKPVAASSFLADENKLTTSRISRSIDPNEMEPGAKTSQFANAGGIGTTSDDPSTIELPIHGTRAYAAMQGRASPSEARYPGEGVSDDNATFTTQSTRGADEDEHAFHHDGMDWE